MLFDEMVDHVHGLRGGEEAYARAIAEEAEVTVVRHHVDWGVPCCLHRRGGARADIVHGGDIASVEAQAGAEAEHDSVGGVGGA